MQEENSYVTKSWIQILEFYSYSNIHIAVCAYFFTIYSFLQFGHDVYDQYAVLIALGTFIIYTLHKIIGLSSRNALEPLPSKFEIVANNKLIFIVLCIVAAIYSCYLFIHLSTTAQVLFLLPAILAILYILPIFKGGKRMRDLPYAKLFILALCWSLLCRWTPLSIAHTSFYLKVISSLSAFFFIAALGLVFDNKDAAVDMKRGVQTFIHLIPQNALMWIVALLLFCCYLLDIISFKEAGINQAAYTGIVVYFLIGLSILITKYVKHELYYTLVLDSTMILFFLTLFL